jgi:hypothetical protein
MMFSQWIACGSRAGRRGAGVRMVSCRNHRRCRRRICQAEKGEPMDGFVLLGGLLAFILLDILALLWGADTRDTAPQESVSDRTT